MVRAALEKHEHQQHMIHSDPGHWRLGPRGRVLGWARKAFAYPALPLDQNRPGPVFKDAVEYQREAVRLG
jgi:hypothetical protein